MPRWVTGIGHDGQGCLVLTLLYWLHYPGWYREDRTSGCQKKKRKKKTCNVERYCELFLIENLSHSGY